METSTTGTLTTTPLITGRSTTTITLTIQTRSVVTDPPRPEGRQFRGRCVEAQDGGATARCDCLSARDGLLERLVQLPEGTPSDWPTGARLPGRARAGLHTAGQPEFPWSRVLVRGATQLGPPECP